MKTCHSNAVMLSEAEPLLFQLVQACDSKLNQLSDVFIIPLWLFKPPLGGLGVAVTRLLHCLFGCFSQKISFFSALLVRRRGSSSILKNFCGYFPCIKAAFYKSYWLLSAVTSVTLPFCNLLNCFTALCYRFVTPHKNACLLLHHCYNLLHHCYTCCYIYCYILFTLIIKELYKNVTEGLCKTQVAGKNSKIKTNGKY